MFVMHRGFLVASAAVAAFAMAAGASLGQDTPPKILGFERMYATAATDNVEAGQLLLGELNCTSCHQADATLTGLVERKQAPVLDTVCSRVKPQYLLKFLADPQATKPGTTMPNVLAGLSEAQRGRVVEEIVHFLATTGSVTHGNPFRTAVSRGQTLFHSVGCVACHDPRTDQPNEPLAASISLGTPSRKYTLPGLTQFLQDPLAVRPGGRMPHLNLTAAEARDIGSFLLSDLDVVSGLQYVYYEGQWDKLPKFDKLTPAAIGDAENFDLTPARRRDNFALRFEGTIHLPKDGDYLFLIGSDDGSRLLIDDKLVVNNDGVHPFEQKRKKLTMTAGLHSVVVEFFEQEGDEALQVDFEGPGMQQQPLASVLTTPAVQKGTISADEPFVVDPVKAAKGREHFVSLGCAACHTLRIDGSPMTATKLAQPLAKLPARGGCLDDRSAQAPRYALSDRQKAALSAAIVAAKSPAKERTPDALVNRTLARFNCVACHERNKQGGVLAARDAFFLSDMPEMGDEGRIPPSLTGVGAKLTSQWLKTLLDQGAKDRPYLFTRMPKFGAANVGELVAAFEAADATFMKPAPTFHVASEDEKRIKAAGRRLVGAQGFACIKCHTFAGQRSTGIQALSLTTMTRRLKPEWFHAYLQNPLAYRPGTRMPTPFPDGKTTLPSVLNGTVDGQTGAIWTYLADGDKALFPVGLVTGKIELVAFDEAVIYRNFLDGAGTRAIGVGYPEKLNLAFDANNLRLAMLWHGGFIDAARHWSARGAGFEKPLGDNVLRLPDGPPLAVLENADAPWPSGAAKDSGFKFEGYRLGEKRQPTILYSWQQVKVEDEPRPVGEQDVFSMQRRLMFTADRPPTGAWFRAMRAGKIDELSGGTYRIDDRWTLKVIASTKPRVREQGGMRELLIPLIFNGNKAQIELTYDW